MRNFCRGSFALLLIIGLIPARGSRAQEITFPDFRNMEIVQEYPVFVADNLWDYINGAADSYLSCAFEELHIAEYVKGEDLTIKVEVYRHRDPLMAYGIYAMERSPSYHFIDLGVQAYREEGLVHFLKGPFYVKVVSYSDHPETEDLLLGLAKTVESALKGSTQMPSLIAAYPEKDLVQNDILFIAENVLGYPFFREAFRATYQDGAERYYLFLFEHPGEDLAAMMEELFRANDKSPEVPERQLIRFEDKYNGHMLLYHEANRLFVVPGKPRGDEYAKQLILKAAGEQN